MRVLFVDDDSGIRALARLALERKGGFTVEICASGAEALKRAASFSPDVIILDVMMPGMDGIETLRALRKLPETASIPVIFLTANTRAEEVNRYREEGAVEVIAKPFDPLTLASTVAEIIGKSGGAPGGDIAEKLRLLGESFEKQIDEQILRLEELLDSLMPDAPETLNDMLFIAHGIAGSAGSFGYPALSDSARRLESFLKRPTIGRLSESGLRELIAFFFDDMKAASALRRQGWEEIMGPPSAPPSHPREGRLIYLLEDDALFARDVALQLGYFGYSVRSFGKPDALKQALADSQPCAIISDVVLSEGRLAGVGAVNDIVSRSAEKISAIFVSSHGDFEARFEAVKAGGEAYFTKPLNVGALIDKLDSLISCTPREPYRILLVDDDPELAARHSLILEGAGMTTEVINDPRGVMLSLTDFRPELILTDVYMPFCNGIELAKIIRQQDAFVGVPIVFLSSETDVDRQLLAMSIGGDDFLTKPIKPWHLVSAVSARVERYRTLRTFMIRDSLTGLLNHTKTKEHLDVEVSRSMRQGGSLAFALMDIDRFKSVNDTYGHFIGDQVIISLSRLLKQRLRKSDAIGRYGGEEFAVILPGTDGEGAAKILNEIRKDFALIRHQHKRGEFSVTFSCGVAAFPAYGQSSRLNEAADNALYAAKHQGRNRVVISEPPAS